MSLLAVNYHYVGMPKFKYQGVNGLDLEDFLVHVRFLKSNFKLIGLSDLGHLEINNDNYCIITFDDGLLCHYDVIFKLMKKENFPAAFFINTMPLEIGKAIPTHKMHIIKAKISNTSIKKELKVFMKLKNLVFPSVDKDLIKSSYKYDDYESACLKYIINYFLAENYRNEFINILFKNLFADETSFVKEWYINEKQIKEMNEFLPCIGSHGHFHVPFGKLSSTEVIDDLKISKRILEELLGDSINFFSYPLGNKHAVKEIHAELVNRAGYDFAFTMEREQNITYQNKHLLARIDCNDLPVVGKDPMFELKNDKFLRQNGSLSKRKRYFKE